MKELDKEQLETIEEVLKKSGNITNYRDRFIKKGLLKEEFEVGEWYKYGTDLLVWNRGDSTYGFNSLNNWGDDYLFSCQSGRKATSQEVEEALIKEVKKRGFEEGVSVRVKGDWMFEGTASNHLLNHPTFSFKDGYLNFGGMYIFKNGKWATIISEEKTIEERLTTIK